MNRLYLVRHGENPANLTKEFSHRLIDYPLTLKGILQAQQTADYFADKDIHEIYSSPLKRTLQTAEILASRLNLSVVVLENFREVNPGVLESQPASTENWDLFIRVFDSWFSGHFEARCPGGEDYFEFWQRIRQGFEQIVAGKTGRNIVVVGHGGVFMVALKELCQTIDLGWLRRSESPNCSITQVEIEWRDRRLEGDLIEWAYCSHLRGVAAELISGLPEANSFAGSGSQGMLDVLSTWSRPPGPG